MYNTKAFGPATKVLDLAYKILDACGEYVDEDTTVGACLQLYFADHPFPEAKAMAELCEAIEFYRSSYECGAPAPYCHMKAAIDRMAADLVDAVP